MRGARHKQLFYFEEPIPQILHLLLQMCVSTGCTPKLVQVCNKHCCHAYFATLQLVLSRIREAEECEREPVLKGCSLVHDDLELFFARNLVHHCTAIIRQRQEEPWIDTAPCNLVHRVFVLIKCLHQSICRSAMIMGDPSTSRLGSDAVGGRP